MNQPLVACLLLALTACASPDARNSALEELGNHTFPITSSSKAAQELFDQGLAWCYGFHHAEAIRCFTAAITADPDCAMAHWGLAFAAGPHINNMAMSAEAAEQAHRHAQTAKRLAGAASPLERALIEAITARYAWPAPDDRKQLDIAWADAMRPVYQAHGDHPDVAALFAESLMDLRPWDLWQKDGSPQPGTPEILTVLEKLLAAHPRHPQGNHLYIHAVEASPAPERALAAAERLIDLAPAIGHLVHMPAHILQRVGRYQDAAQANRRGIAADLAIVARTGRTGFYELYRAHNYHFLAYSAMFAGRADEAIGAAREMIRELPMAVVQEMPSFLEGFLGAPYHTLVRFGRWQELLAEPAPEPWQKSRLAFWHYGRAIAFAALAHVAEAVAERDAFLRAVADVPSDWLLGNNPLRTVLAIGEQVVEGEVEFRRGNHDVAFAALHKAAELDDALHYDEPWGWMMPPRHALGALLLEAGKVDDAEAVYRQDLIRHPENGWALRGLIECLERRGLAAEATAMRARFASAWQHASVTIDASCFCRR